MSQSSGTVRRSSRLHLESLQNVLRSLSQNDRQVVSEFWRNIRNGFDALDDEIEKLRGELESARRPRSAVPRPDTANLVDTMRRDYDNAITNQSLGVLDASETLEKVWDLDPVQAQEIVTRARSATAERGSELGCWLSANAAAHPDGYQKINLRNTVNRSTRQKIDCSPWAHQLAIIAKGQGNQLLVTRNGQMEVSHLCHNGGCFNPNHLVVETSGLNRSRNRCAGSFITVCGCGTTYHPCSHGGTEHHRVCILPKRNISCGGYYEASNTGPVRRV